MILTLKPIFLEGQTEYELQLEGISLLQFSDFSSYGENADKYWKSYTRILTKYEEFGSNAPATHHYFRQHPDEIPGITVL